MKEAKAVAKKETKQRQKEKKKGKEKERSKDVHVTADQVSEGVDKDAEEHLMQQQAAGDGGASSIGGVEPSGNDTVVLAGDGECFLAPSKPGGTGSSAPGSPPGFADGSVTATLHAAVAGTAGMSAADTTTDTVTHVASAADAPIPAASSTAAAACGAEGAPAAGTVASVGVQPPTSNQQHPQHQHPILQFIMSRTIPNLEQPRHILQPQIVQPQHTVLPQIVQLCIPVTPLGGDIALTLAGAAQASTLNFPAYPPTPQSQAAPVGAYNPLRRQPPSTTAATSSTVPHYTAKHPYTVAAPSIGAPNTNPVRRTAYPPPPLAAHGARPVVAGHTSATQPAIYPAHIQRLGHAALASVGLVSTPIPSAVLSALPRTPLQQGRGAVGAMAAGAQDDDDDDMVCVVCMERERNVFLQPCGHVIMCSHCCDEVLAKSSLCPICRTQVLEHVILE